ncbi:MAG: hypothetical protein ACUVQK_15405, partial [Thermogutta sp.]
MLPRVVAEGTPADYRATQRLQFRFRLRRLNVLQPAARQHQRAVLRRHGWTLAKPAGSDGNEHWRRPGKTAGSSATLKDGVFYVFSSS